MLTLTPHKNYCVFTFHYTCNSVLVSLFCYTFFVTCNPRCNLLTSTIFLFPSKQSRGALVMLEALSFQTAKLEIDFMAEKFQFLVLAVQLKTASYLGKFWGQLWHSLWKGVINKIKLFRSDIIPISTLIGGISSKSTIQITAIAQ